MILRSLFMLETFYIFYVALPVFYALYLWLQKADSVKSLLDVKEKELLALELKLSAREKVSLGTW